METYTTLSVKRADKQTLENLQVEIISKLQKRVLTKNCLPVILLLAKQKLSELTDSELSALKEKLNIEI